MAIAFSSMPPSAAAAAVEVGAREAAILRGSGRGFAETLRERQEQEEEEARVFSKLKGQCCILPAWLRRPRWPKEPSKLANGLG